MDKRVLIEDAGEVRAWRVKGYQPPRWPRLITSSGEMIDAGPGTPIFEEAEDYALIEPPAPHPDYDLIARRR